MPAHELPPSPGSEEVEARAADWLARIDAGLSSDEQIQFQRWLATGPREGEAWRAVTAAWKILDRPRQTEGAAAMVRELAARRRRRHWKAGLGMAAGLAAAVMFVRLEHPARPSRAEGPPASANAILYQPERRVLADGSVVELNQGAEIEVSYLPERRSVRLVRGEAHFAVAKNAARPFVVTASAIEVRAVGTEFVVRIESRRVDVLVTEGRVAVNRTAAGLRPPVLVAAGDYLDVPVRRGRDEILRAQSLSPLECARRLAWRGLRLELSGTSLAETVSLLNRTNRVQLSIDDPQLKTLRMSGIFRADNADGFVRLLESNYGVRAERRGPDRIVLHPAP